MFRNRHIHIDNKNQPPTSKCRCCGRDKDKPEVIEEEEVQGAEVQESESEPVVAVKLDEALLKAWATVLQSASKSECDDEYIDSCSCRSCSS